MYLETPSFTLYHTSVLSLSITPESVDIHKVHTNGKKLYSYESQFKDVHL